MLGASAVEQDAMTYRAPLAGLRVLDFTTMLAGPYASRLLADAGAEVIKVESEHGDHNRERRPLRDGFSSLFGHLNAGKKSVVLDLKSAAGLRHARALAVTCDIAIENWRPGVADRLGVGYADLRALRPDIIFCAISGYGQTGPGADRAAYAPIIHANCGYDLMQLQHLQAPNLAPATGTYVADVFGGLAAFAAIQMALFDRERTGSGRFIDVALFDGMINLLVFECQAVQFPSQPPRIHRAVATTDGYIVITPTSQKNFEALAHAVGHPEWVRDARFAATTDRERNWTTLMQLIGEWTSQRTAADAEALLISAGVPCSRYRALADALADPQSVSRNVMADVTDGAGTFRVPNPPFRMQGLDTTVRPYVARLGEHTDEVLSAPGRPRFPV